MALEKELETYKNKLGELKAQGGKFALIQGDKIVDTYSSYEDAIKEGYLHFGVATPFLVKQILAMEQAHFSVARPVPYFTLQLSPLGL